MSGIIIERDFKVQLKFKNWKMPNGISTLFLHASFAFKRLANNEPELRDIQASLKTFVQTLLISG